MFIIEDGKGTGKKAQVDDANRLMTYSVVVKDAAHSSEEGLAFSAPTDFIALTTTGVWHGIWYLKNNNSHTIHIEFIRVSNNLIGGIVQWKLVKNPTTGTLISAGTTVSPLNTEFGSAISSSSDFKIGSDSKTVTDGEHYSQLQHTVGSERLDVDGTISLPPGKSIALVCKISAACEVGSTLQFYKHEHTV